MKEGRLHCWNRSKKEDHIVGTDPISNIKMAVSILTIQIVVRIARILFLQQMILWNPFNEETFFY